MINGIKLLILRSLLFYEKISLYFLSILLFTASCKKTNKNSAPQETPVQESVPQWQVYNQANSGLTNNQINAIAIDINAIAIDKNDIKWVGTSAGLITINGNNWKNYTKTNSLLPSENIQALAIQNNGTIWIGTDAGLVKFDGLKWHVYTKQNSQILDDSIMSLCYDNLTKKIWVGTAKGLFSIDEDGKQELFDEFEGNLILSMAVDKNGALWMGCFDHFKFNGSVVKFQNNQLTSYRLDVLGYNSAFPYGLAINQNNNVVVTLTGTAVSYQI